MGNICANVRAFQASSRGKNLHPGTSIPPGVFTYDFDTGGKTSEEERLSASFNRRSHSCPKTWKNNRCPQAGQKNPWRHDGEWWTKDIEPGSDTNMLQHKREDKNDKDKITEYSYIRYTCDEFPPATWFEGGDGWKSDQPANTWCAGHACVQDFEPRPSGAPSVKAEQNWQAFAHNKLRDVLLSHINDRQNEFPWYDPQNPQRDMAFFRFGIIDGSPDGIAATVFVTDDVNHEDDDYEYITQSRRSLNQTTDEEGLDEPTRTPRSRHGLTFEQAYQRMRAGLSRRVEIIPAIFNDSAVEKPVFDRMGTAETENPSLEDHKLNNNATWRSKVPKRVASSMNVEERPLLKKASLEDLEKARAIVTAAVDASAKLNKARMESPMRNYYRSKSGAIIDETTSKERRKSPGYDNPTDSPVSPLLEITDEIAWAAALMAEAQRETFGGGSSPTPSNITRRAASRGQYWMESIARKGIVSWGDDASYAVFRNVLDYGAVGNGVTDDTAAIKRALNDGRRCGEKCNGSTVKNAIVYFPPGNYLISTTVPLPFGTQVIGDALDRPVLVASTSFIGLGVLSTNEYTDFGQQWYVNTANFYRQIRNIIIDVRPAPASEETACLHYQVAPATSMQNVELRAGPGQKGIFAENGSGGGISDVTFVGGDVGLYGGEHQFTAQRLVFRGCDVGVHVIWDWGWVWKSVNMTNVGVGFRFVPDFDDGSVGSSVIMDSSFTNVRTVVV